MTMAYEHHPTTVVSIHLVDLCIYIEGSALLLAPSIESPIHYQVRSVASVTEPCVTAIDQINRRYRSTNPRSEDASHLRMGRNTWCPLSDP
jgi:hypothetical protein